MASRAARSLAKEQYWREVINGWRRSNGSVRQWCSQRQISEPSFYSWRRVLAERDAVGASQELGFERALRKPSRAAILPVEIGPFRSPQESAPLEISFPEGLRILVRPGCPALLLREVLAALRPERGEPASC